MIKIAFARAGYDKGATEDVKNVFTNSELSKSIEEFSQKYKVVDIQPFGSHMVMIKYEE